MQNWSFNAHLKHTHADKSHWNPKSFNSQICNSNSQLELATCTRNSNLQLANSRIPWPENPQHRTYRTHLHTDMDAIYLHSVPCVPFSAETWITSSRSGLFGPSLWNNKTLDFGQEIGNVLGVTEHPALPVSRHGERIFPTPLSFSQLWYIFPKLSWF